MNSHDPSYSCMPSNLCDYCESSDHDTCNCLCHNYVDAKCASVEKMINDMNDKMIETMKERIAKYS